MQEREVASEGSEVSHLAELLEEEMATRGWSREDLSMRMTGIDPKDWAITHLALEFFLEVRNTDMTLGDEMAHQFAKAFGTSPEFFANLHESWRKWAKNAEVLQRGREK